MSTCNKEGWRHLYELFWASLFFCSSWYAGRCFDLDARPLSLGGAVPPTAIAVGIWCVGCIHPSPWTGEGQRPMVSSTNCGSGNLPPRGRGLGYSPLPSVAPRERRSVTHCTLPRVVLLGLPRGHIHAIMLSAHVDVHRLLAVQRDGGTI